MGYKVGHARESVAKATTKGSGISGAAGKGGGKGKTENAPKISRLNK